MLNAMRHPHRATGGLCAAEKGAAVEDDMPRLACPDLVDAIKRWQEVWENLPEPGGDSFLTCKALALSTRPAYR